MRDCFMRSFFTVILFFPLYTWCSDTIVSPAQNVSMNQTKPITHERIHPKNILLSWLYTSVLSKPLRLLLTQRWVSIGVGWLANRSLSKYLIPAFIQAQHINTQEILPEEYATFNEFFYRKLKPDARPIDNDPASFISPCDGNLMIVPDITPTTEFLVKNKSFNLECFLHDKNLAEKFYHGTMVVIYLAPSDYHRFHAPLDCIPEQAIRINGKYESVNTIVYQAGIQPLTENERQLTILKTSSAGDIAYVSVGALFVGGITHTYQAGQLSTKGDDFGYFSFGGSTVVLLLQPNTFNINPALEQELKKHGNASIKMGMPLGTIIQNNQFE